MEKTILQAWRENYETLKSRAASDGNTAHAYLDDAGYSFVVAEYRPDYAQWFSSPEEMDVLGISEQLIDSLDKAMFHQFMQWAWGETYAEFERATASLCLYYDRGSDWRQGHYTKSETYAAFYAWCKAKGIEL